jgi:hypothetical protein
MIHADLRRLAEEFVQKRKTRRLAKAPTIAELEAILNAPDDDRPGIVTINEDGSVSVDDRSEVDKLVQFAEAVQAQAEARIAANVKAALWAAVTDIGGGKCYLKANIDDLVDAAIRADQPEGA